MKGVVIKKNKLELSPADGRATDFSQGCCVRSCGSAGLHRTQLSPCSACSSVPQLVPRYRHRIQIILCTLWKGSQMLPLWDALVSISRKNSVFFHYKHSIKTKTKLEILT